jgi:hypothetical protein
MNEFEIIHFSFFHLSIYNINFDKMKKGRIIINIFSKI